MSNTTTTTTTSSVLRDAAIAVASAMEGDKYALVGDAACSLLGSRRRRIQTLDFVVPRGKTAAARSRLRGSTHGTLVVEPRTNYTRFDDSVDIQILTPPLLFPGGFDEDTLTVVVDGVHLLKPALVLDAKCHAIINAHSNDRRKVDAEDVLFLLGYHARSSIPISAVEVPNVTDEFVDLFVRIRGGRELWEAAGYHLGRGWLV